MADKSSNESLGNGEITIEVTGTPVPAPPLQKSTSRNPEPEEELPYYDGQLEEGTNYDELPYYNGSLLEEEERGSQ